METGTALPTKTPRSCSPCKTAHVTCNSWTKFSNTYEGSDDEALHGFRILLWEHLRGGSFHPLHPDSCLADLTQTCAYPAFLRFIRFRVLTRIFFYAGRLHSYREFLLLHLTPCAPRAYVPPRTSPSLGCRPAPTVVISSDSESETSEEEHPTPKRRRSSRTRRTHRTPHPEVLEVTDKDDISPLANDPRNYNLEEGDVSMAAPKVPIAINKRNYDPRLEPVPPVVPPEQQASSSRATLDDPPPSLTHFLGFRLQLTNSNLCLLLRGGNPTASGQRRRQGSSGESSALYVVDL